MKIILTYNLSRGSVSDEFDA